MGRHEGWAAGIVAGITYFGGLAYCSFLCAGIGEASGYFGAQTHHALFIWGGLIPAFGSAFFYGWVLFSARGNGLLTQLGGCSRTRLGSVGSVTVTFVPAPSVLSTSKAPPISSK